MSEKRLAEAVKRSVEILSAEGLGAYLDFIEPWCAPDVEFLPILDRAEGGPVQIGFAPVRRYTAVLERAYPGWYYKNAEVEAVGERVFVVRAEMASRESPDSGPSGPLSMVVVFNADGLVARFFGYESHENAMADAREEAGHD